MGFNASVKMAEAMRATVASLLNGIDRYNPENLGTLERYVEMQARDNTYDLEANLAILKLYQFNPNFFQANVTAQIMLKSLTNLPHTDFTLCKCLVDVVRLEEEPLLSINIVAELLETCQFKSFWKTIAENPDLIMGITDFEDSIRKFICHVVGTTYERISKPVLLELLGDIQEYQFGQWVHKYGWKDEGQEIFIVNQDDNIKTKNITERIGFEGVAHIMRAAAVPGTLRN